MIHGNLMGRRTSALLVVAVVAITLLASCGIYSLSGSTLKGIKTIAVPVFDNQTTEYGLREDLTEAVTNGLIADNTLKVVNIRRADAALRGTITKYERECYTFDGAGNCQEYVARVFVDIAFEDLKNKKVIWEEKGIEGFGIYSAATESDADGKKEAIQKLTVDIIDKVIKGW